MEKRLISTRALVQQCQYFNDPSYRHPNFRQCDFTGGLIRLWVFTAPAPISLYVDTIVVGELLSTDGSDFLFAHLPSAEPWLQLSLAGDTRFVTSRFLSLGQFDLLAPSYLVGMYDHPQMMEISKLSVTVNVRLRPEAVGPIFKLGSGIFEAGCIDINDTGSRTWVNDLQSQLCDVRCVKRVHALVVDALTVHIADCAAPSREVRLLVDALQQYGGTKAVQHCSEQLGMSTRSINAIIQRYTGTSPKRLAQLSRFHRAVRSMVPNLWVGGAEIGATEYYDDSHRIHEFRKYSGMSPLELAKRKQHDPLSYAVRMNPD
jgi:AraC-like DNA-binding protein